MEKNKAAMMTQFENIYSQYARKIYNYIYSRLLHRESAEDVTSEVLYVSCRIFTVTTLQKLC